MERLTELILDYKATDNEPETVMATKIKIYFDGGCSPNPGNKYGSYEVWLEDYPILRKSRVEFGHGTNNEAEFNALQAALEDLRRWSVITGFDLSDASALVTTDSRIVQNRLMGKNRVFKKAKWKESSERMFKLANDIINYGLLFNSFTVQWKPREMNVERFGH